MDKQFLIDEWNEEGSYFCETVENVEVDGNAVLGRVSGAFFFPGATSSNKRHYPLHFWEAVLKGEELKKKLESRLMFGTIGHDKRPVTDEDLRKGVPSHVVSRLWIEKKSSGFVGRGEALILNTETGKNLWIYLKAGCRLGISQRAWGSVAEKNSRGDVIPNSEDFVLEGFDFTVIPGFWEALPQLMESLSEEGLKEEDLRVLKDVFQEFPLWKTVLSFDLVKILFSVVGDYDIRRVFSLLMQLDSILKLKEVKFDDVVERVAPFLFEKKPLEALALAFNLYKAYPKIEKLASDCEEKGLKLGEKLSVTEEQVESLQEELEEKQREFREQMEWEEKNREEREKDFEEVVSQKESFENVLLEHEEEIKMLETMNGSLQSYMEEMETLKKENKDLVSKVKGLLGEKRIYGVRLKSLEKKLNAYSFMESAYKLANEFGVPVESASAMLEESSFEEVAKTLKESSDLGNKSDLKSSSSYIKKKEEPLVKRMFKKIREV